MNAFPSTMMDEELNLWDFLERAAALFGRKEVVSRLHTGEVHRTTYAAVSYTHLTLPTICSV